MSNRDILIKIEIYAPYSRRVKIYAPAYLRFFYNRSALSRDQYADYFRTLHVVAKTVKDIHYQDKVSFHVRPWYLWFWKPFLRGYFHSPVVFIGGELVSAGSAPDKAKIKESLTKIDLKYRFLEKK